eukprot:g22635.t1
MTCEDLERRWSMRKGHRHLLESLKGRSTFSHSISKKLNECDVANIVCHLLTKQENVEPFCFDTDFDSEFDDDSLSEASWSFSRQSTTGSVSSLETLSASDPPVVTTALRFVAERWEEAQVVADAWNANEP